MLQNWRREQFDAEIRDVQSRWRSLGLSGIVFGSTGGYLLAGVQTLTCPTRSGASTGDLYMMKSALIFVDRPTEDDDQKPRAMLNVGGLTLLERQLRQLKDAGVERVRVVTRDYPEFLFNAVGKFRKVPGDVSVIDGNMPTDAELMADEGDSVLVIEDGVLIDDRIIKSILAAGEGGSAAIALFPPRAVTFGQGAGSRISLEGEDRLFASAAAIPWDVFRSVMAVALPHEPLQTLLEDAMAGGLSGTDVEFVDISEFETYEANRRREVPILWRPVTVAAECARATRVLLNMAQKGVLDWPARWIHPPFEDLCVVALLRTFVTPNMITVLTGIMGGGIAYLFATGQMGIALAGALAVGVLDGVDGKLARVKRLTSKVGEMEHLVDKVVEYAWYVAIAYYLSGVTGDGAPWVLSLVIIGFAWAEVVQGELFRRLTLKQLDDAGAFERRFRIIGARRNTIVWIWIPFALTEQWAIGFWLAAVYTMATFFVAQWRFIVRIRDYALSEGSAIADNIRRTEYF